jgi:hypothetical protein
MVCPAEIKFHIIAVAARAPRASHVHIFREDKCSTILFGKVRAPVTILPCAAFVQLRAAERDIVAISARAPDACDKAVLIAYPRIVALFGKIVSPPAGGLVP